MSRLVKGCLTLVAEHQESGMKRLHILTIEQPANVCLVGVIVKLASFWATLGHRT